MPDSPVAPRPSAVPPRVFIGGNRPIFRPREPAAPAPTRREVIGVLERGLDRLLLGWTQGAHARNTDSKPVDPEDPGACCWCLTGSLHPVPEGAKPVVVRLLRQAIERTDPASSERVLTEWNDAAVRQPEEVVAAIRRAKQLAEETL